MVVLSIKIGLFELDLSLKIVMLLFRLDLIILLSPFNLFNLLPFFILVDQEVVELLSLCC